MKKQLLSLLSFIALSYGSMAQTTLISPAGDGGFENGTTLTANGWTAVNSAANQWHVGTASFASGINSAYISNDGGNTNAYTNSTSSVSHFYRDINFPAGENKIKLTFKLKGDGDQLGATFYDKLIVYVSPTSFTPATSAPASSGTALSGATLVYAQNGNFTPGYTTVTVYLPASLAGTTSRLIFTWHNDGTDGVTPSSVDDIELISSLPGNFISIATGNWSNPLTWDANDVPTAGDNVTVTATHTVAIDQANQASANMQLDGVLSFSATPTQFNINGNLLVSATGTLNAFNGTTGKNLFVSGNITNNGLIDLTKGTNTATSILTLNGTSVQTVSGSGTFLNGIIRNLTLNNTSTAIPNIIWNMNNISIGGNLTFTNGKVNLNGNKLILGTGIATGTGAGAIGALITSAGNGFMPNGTFSRWWSNTNTGSAFTAGTDPSNATSRYPFLNASGLNRAAYIERVTPSAGGQISCTYQDANTTSTVNIVDGAYTVERIYDGNWTFSTESTSPAAASHKVALIAPNAYVGINGNSRVVGASAIAGGTHQNGTTTPGAQRLGLSLAELTAGALYIGAANADIAQPCTGIPSAGTTSASSGTVCANTNFTLNLVGQTTGETGITIQWERSTDNVLFSSIPSATLASAVLSQTIATYYRAIVTCTNSASSATSTTVFVDLNSFLNCYCVAATTTGDPSDIITNVSLVNSIGGTFTQASGGAAPYFTSYTNTPLNLYESSTNTVSITFGIDGNQHSAAWIDFNRNGIYETTENIALSVTSAGSNATVVYTFSVPTGASAGITRMRVRGASDAAYSAAGACNATGYGETEDYLVNIIPASQTPPAISYVPVLSSCSTVGSSLTATITSVNGIPTSGAGLPVLYWAINSGTYTSVTATSIGSNQYTFNFGSGVAQGDVVSYYVVAQDNSGSPILSTFPVAGSAGLTANPPTAATAPTSPSTYTIQSPLTGTFSVGAAGTYTSLTQAVNVYNNSCLAGPVVFELIDANYSTNETFPIVINHNPDASSVNNLTIRPAAANSATITGNALNIIKFNGAKFITVDGSNNGSNSRNLTINTTNTSSAVVVWIGNSSPTQPANSITVKNSTIFGNTGTTTIGNILIGSGVALGGASEIPNNNITIENNRMYGAQNCIFASGNATTPDQNWNFSKNTIGNSNDLFKSIRGILVQNAQNITINENDINGGYNTGTGRTTGITSGINTSNVTISKNKITDIKNAEPTGFGANGILLSPNLTNANINVINNFISDIAGIGYSVTAGPDDNGYGIVVLNGGGIKLYNNTISLYNQGVNGLPSALNIASTATVVGGIDVRNNIFNVTQNVATNAYAIYSAANANVFSNIDNNNYSTTTANLGFIGSNRATLADIIAGFGGNANSTTVTPTFASGVYPYDLHLPLTTANVGLLDRAVVLATVTDDIDNQTRGTAPDMGADEFGNLPATPPAPIQSTVTPSCVNGTTLSVVGTPPVNVTWYWQGTNANGTSTLSPTSTDLVVNINGTYYVRAYDASIDAWSINSSSISVTNIPVAPTPPVPVVLNNPACFSTEISVPNPIGSLVYYWQGTNATGTSTTQVATSPYTVTTSGTYYVAAYNTANQCWSTTNGAAVTINTYVPGSPTVTPGAINICTGSSNALLNASTPATSNTITIPFISSTYNLAGSASNTIAATIVGIPNGATITSANLVFNGVTTLGLTWLNDITIGLSGAATVPNNLLGPGAPATNGGPYSFNASSVSNGVTTLTLTNDWSDGINFNNINLVIGYTLPASTVQWYSAASSGTLEGTGSPFDAVGTSVLPSTSSAGSYTLYAASESGGCVNPTRTPAVVNVTSVLANLTPIDVSCNGYTNGTFTLGTVTCGTQPFEYSINGGAFSSSIPTNLSAGTYTVIIKDNVPNQSAPILVTINQPTTTIATPLAGTTPTVCLGDLNAIVTATSNINTFSTYTTTINIATNVTLAPGTTTVFPTIASLPIGATVTATSLVFNGFTTNVGTLGIDIDASLTGAINMAPAVIPALTANNANLSITAPLLSNSGGNFVLILEDTDPTGGGSTTSSIDLVVAYNLPNAASLTWWNASTTGTQIGTGSPLNAVGTSVLPNTNTPGTYTLFAQGEFGGCNSVNRTPVTVVVNPLPTVSVSASSSVVCSGSSATLTAGGSATSFTWSPLGGNASTAVVNPTVQTTYTLVGSALGCSASATTTINVNALPTVNAFATSTTAICAGTTETLTAAGSATNFTWTPSGITSGNAVVNPTVTTTYTLTGNDGICSNTANVTVTVTPLPTLNLAASNTVICSGTTSSATLTASGTSSTYTWSPISNNTATAVVTPTANATYTVTGEALGCTNTRTIEIAVSSAPSLSVVALGGANICTGNTGTLSAAGSATSFTWSPVGGNGSTAVITPTASTETYTVTGEANGCTSQASIIVTVNAIPTVTATAANATICNGENSVLTANTSATTFSWSTGANTASTTVTPTTTTVYTVTVTENGCSESTTVTVNVNACTGIEEQLAKDINLYPNPTTGLLNIVIPEEMVSKSIIEMYDGLGKLVAREELTKTTTKVYMNKLEEGMYFYKIISDTKEMRVGKVIKH